MPALSAPARLSAAASSPELFYARAGEEDLAVKAQDAAAGEGAQPPSSMDVFKLAFF
jgi:hypothetical protein